MRIRFFASDKPRERALAMAFQAGAEAHGNWVDIAPLGPYPALYDVTAACMVGVKSRRIFDACLEASVLPIMFDKGYIRDRRTSAGVWEFWRVSIGAHHPTDYLIRERLPEDRRFDQMGDLPMVPWRKTGEHIILAGSSAKYHAFYGLSDPTTWARRVVADLRELTRRQIVYRPKPSWREAVPITKTQFSGPKDKLRPLLDDAWAVVTHGSNVSFEAALAGVPSIVLGNGIGRAISSTDLGDIDRPLLGKREQWLNNLCYWQWTEDEMQSGAMWEFLEPRIKDRR